MLSDSVYSHAERRVSMLAPAVSEDYRRDRIERCKAYECIDYRVLRDRGVFLLGAEGLAYLDELEAVLTEKNVAINEAAISNNEFMIAFDLKNAPLDDTSREELEHYAGGRLLITDDREKAGYISAIVPVLYAPRIYGAGLENGENAHENESMNASDLLGAVLFLASRRRTLRICVYYAGHGGCTVKGAKSVESGGYDRIMSYDDAKKMLSFSEQHPDELFYFDDSYSGQLELLHKRLFECLEEFDRICRENEISYFLGGGSLLGAARHGNIIPWDDDMDVMMTREEYDKFLSVVDKSINKEDFFFQSSATDPMYHSIFTKLRMNGTVYATAFSKEHYHLHQGVFIDIFVHDKTSDLKLLRKLHVFLTLFARSMVFNKWAEKPMHFYGKLKPVCKLATFFIEHSSIKTLEKIQHKAVTFFDKRRTRYLYDGTGEHLRHGGFPAKWLSETEYLQFGKNKYPVPAGYERYLSYSYGSDWQKLIPASLRKSGHDVVEFDFNKK